MITKIVMIVMMINIKILMKVNAEDMKGEATPLYYAALAGCEPAVDLLLLYGGDAQNSNTGEKVSIADEWCLPVNLLSIFFGWFPRF